MGELFDRDRDALASVGSGETRTQEPSTVTLMGENFFLWIGDLLSLPTRPKAADARPHIDSVAVHRLLCVISTTMIERDEGM